MLRIGISGSEIDTKERFDKLFTVKSINTEMKVWDEPECSAETLLWIV